MDWQVCTLACLRLSNLRLHTCHLRNVASLHVAVYQGQLSCPSSRVQIVCVLLVGLSIISSMHRRRCTPSCASAHVRLSACACSGLAILASPQCHCDVRLIARSDRVISLSSSSKTQYLCSTCVGALPLPTCHCPTAHMVEAPNTLLHENLTKTQIYLCIWAMKDG